MIQGKSESLNEKVEKVLGLLEQVKHENASLEHENVQLRAELVSIKKECRNLKLVSADRSEAARGRLTAILDRLEELEALN